ncbi:MAG TPA: DUF2164 domain-containing protein [Gemmatimonadaceae bacterium]|jgi:uncharacterized protein (DUF2164 family)
MTVEFELSDDSIAKMLTSIKRYFTEQREEEIGDLQAKLLLDFVLAEIGPSIYNAAITDAQVYLRDRVADLDGACFKPEFGYWLRLQRRR